MSHMTEDDLSMSSSDLTLCCMSSIYVFVQRWFEVNIKTGLYFLINTYLSSYYAKKKKSLFSFFLTEFCFLFRIILHCGSKNELGMPFQVNFKLFLFH